jgi:hypothetical protein
MESERRSFLLALGNALGLSQGKFPNNPGLPSIESLCRIPFSL